MILQGQVRSRVYFSGLRLPREARSAVADTEVLERVIEELTGLHVAKSCDEGVADDDKRDAAADDERNRSRLPSAADGNRNRN